MKLRIYGNSVRLRISQTDLEVIERDGRVESWTGFGPHRRFVYALEADPDAQVLAADFADDALTLSIPASWIGEWSSEDRVGFESMQKIDGDQELHIMVEKDLECLHRDSQGEDRFAQRASA